MSSQPLDIRHQTPTSRGATTTSALVLVVSDNADLQNQFRAKLEARGLRVVGQSTARTALAELRENPSLVLVSDTLPDASGLAFIRAARQQQFPGPVVLMKGNEPAEAMSAVDATLEPRNLRARLREFERQVVCETYEQEGPLLHPCGSHPRDRSGSLWRKLRSYRSSG